MKIYFRDRNPQLVHYATHDQNFNNAGVFAALGSPTDLGVDAVVSPANSFGFMNGGIDYHYAETFPGIQQIVQDEIAAYTEFNELLVGDALVVRTNGTIPWLIVAPTMRVPMKLPDSSNVYLATRAAIRKAYNIDEISSVCLCGMGTGVGGLSYPQSIKAMGLGIKDALVGDFTYRTIREANIYHYDIIDAFVFDTLIPKV